MALGGARPGSGRPRGAASKKSAAIANEAARTGLTPLEVMIKAMRFYDAAGDIDKAAAAARDAAPYMHPRLSNVSGNMTLKYAELSDDALAAALARYVGGDEPDGEAELSRTAH